MRIKFDVVEGNPPFQNMKESGNKSGQSLWSIFTQIAFLRSRDICALVVPSRWCGHSYNIMKGQVRLYSSYIRDGIIAANIGECSKYFHEGLGEEYFSYFVAQKEKSNQLANIITLKSKFKSRINDLPFIPCRPFDSVDIRILNKIYQVGNRIGRFDAFKIVPGKKQHFGKRFLIGYGRYCDYERLLKIFDDGVIGGSDDALSQYYSLDVSNSEEGKNLISIFESDVFSYYAKMFFTVDRIYVGTFKNLPALDYSKKWTNEEVYSYFNITDYERKRIQWFLNNSKRIIQKRKHTLQTEKDKTRTIFTGEVFTPNLLISEIHSFYPERCWKPKKTFLDPSCGNGNFLVATLKEKLNRGHNKEQALSTIYGIDIMKDNVKEAQNRLLEIAGNSEAYKKIVKSNVVQGNTLIFDWNRFENQPILEF